MSILHTDIASGGAAAYNRRDRTRQGYARQRILKLAGHFFGGQP